MSWQERYTFHARLAALIVNAWAEERHQISDSDPERDSKRAENKRGCAAELKRLNQYFFGAKQTWACRECPFMEHWTKTEGSEPY